MSTRKDKANENESILKILETTSRLKVPSIKSKEQAWNELNLTKKKEFILIPPIYLRIAASLLIIFVAGFAGFNLSTEVIKTVAGEHRLVTLPDQSIIKLNASSSIEYNSFTWHFFRKIDFSGEGFFEVEKGSNFQVNTPNGQVEVLGTSFNVRARGSNLEVICVTGKVKVTNKNSIYLSPGTSTSLTGHRLKDPVSYDEKNLKWREGEFYFKNELLKDVVEEIERQFGVTVKLKINEKRYYTGYFNNQNLSEAVKLVCIPLGLKYEVVDETNLIIYK